MKPFLQTIFLVAFLINMPVKAHFQLLLPSKAIVTTDDNQTIQLTLQFTHPMRQGPLMNMAKPQQFGVITEGKSQNLLSTLVAHQQAGKTFYTADYKMAWPGDHIFFVEPAPYWEATEGKMIIHYTKVIVDGFEAGSGWETAVNFPVEIMPLVRPYGLWTGNQFRGIVKKAGKPVPFATVEVEYFNQDLKVTPPAEAFVTQVIKTDAQGVFSYTLPKAGWWGFAALIDSEKTLQNNQGEEVPVELGGLIWVKAVDMQ